jgi:integrase/recombinase XerD
MTSKEWRMDPELVPVISRPFAFAGEAVLPTPIRQAGGRAGARFLEFFTAHIRNPNTRLAHARAVSQFFDWCEARGYRLEDLTPVHLAGYIEHHPAARPTVKQHLAALRMLFDYLATGGVLPMNPAASVRGPKYVVKRGKTPVLTAEQARHLLDAIQTSTMKSGVDTPVMVGLRDRALIGVMVYTFARVGAVITMRVEDYYPNGKRWWFRLHD